MGRGSHSLREAILQATTALMAAEGLVGFFCIVLGFGLFAIPYMWGYSIGVPYWLPLGFAVLAVVYYLGRMIIMAFSCRKAFSELWAIATGNTTVKLNDKINHTAVSVAFAHSVTMAGLYGVSLVLWSFFVALANQTDAFDRGNITDPIAYDGLTQSGAMRWQLAFAFHIAALTINGVLSPLVSTYYLTSVDMRSLRSFLPGAMP